MLHLRSVQSLDAPELAPFRSLRKPDAATHAGRFIAEGPKVIDRLLRSPLQVDALLTTEQWLEHFRPLLAARPEEITVHVALEAQLREVVGFHLFNGVLAAARVPSPAPLAELVATAAARGEWWIALDGITSAENTGTILRSAIAFGARGVLCGETGVSPWLRRSVRVSMGAVFEVPVIESRDLARDLAEFSRAGIPVFSLEPHGGTALSEARLTGPLCLVFGSEGDGARVAVHAACTGRLTVPMPGGFDSLNVAAAAAVAGYEVIRQRSAPRR